MSKLDIFTHAFFNQQIVSGFVLRVGDTSHTHFSIGLRQLELKYYLLVFQKIHIAMYMHPAYAHIYVVYKLSNI